MPESKTTPYRLGVNEVVLCLAFMALTFAAERPHDLNAALAVPIFCVVITHRIHKIIREMV